MMSAVILKRAMISSSSNSEKKKRKLEKIGFFKVNWLVSLGAELGKSPIINQSIYSFGRVKQIKD